jgi:lipopolysaccharide export system protein LptC
MSWRTLLGLVLLVAAIATGWSAWHMRDRDEVVAADGQRSDYILRDFELVMLDKAGVESIRLRAPEMQRRREDESLDIRQPLFLIPGQAPDAPGGWQLSADQGWVSPDGSLAKLTGNVAGDSAQGNPSQIALRTDRLELLPDQHLARTDAPVTLTQPGIIQTGTGMEANMKTRNYRLLSQVKVRYDLK